MMHDHLAPMISATIETPIGDLAVIADSHGNLCMAEFADCEHRIERWRQAKLKAGQMRLVTGGISTRIKAAFAAYFHGEIGAIDAIPVRFGGTAFQNEMWAALRAIKLGETSSYGGFAVRLGRPNSARAVGHANGANPLAIVVPCHRLVGADGSLVNYGGSLHRKRWLLDHERRYVFARPGND